MAKSSIGQVTTTQTFQSWLDKTNQIVTLLETDVMTASVGGDTTTGNSTLIGSFTANTVIAFDTLRANTISPKIGSSSVSITSLISVTNNTEQNVQTLNSSLGPRLQYSSGSAIWRTGFLNTTSNDFIIDFGAGTPKLSLSSTGVLTLSTGAAVGTLVANVTGNVTGTVSDISNHDTDDLSEGSTNQYFTAARARSAISVSGVLSYNASTGVVSLTDSAIRALFSGGTGVTYNSSTGSISIGQAVATSSNVTFANLTTTGTITSTGAITSQGDITAFASSSDIRKKENIKKIENALDKVNRISGYTFNFIGDDRKLAGVIAQEMEEVLPEVVYDVLDNTTGNTSKAVRYGNIVSILIEAIKELNEKVDELRNGN